MNLNMSGFLCDFLFVKNTRGWYSRCRNLGFQKIIVAANLHQYYIVFCAQFRLAMSLLFDAFLIYSLN